MKSRVSIVVTILLLLTGCGSSDGNGDTETSSSEADSPAQTPSDLQGRQFLATEVAGYETTLRLEFLSRNGDIEEIGWQADCNRHGAEVRISPDRIVTGGMSHTEMGCPADEQAVDDALVELFRADPTWRSQGSELIIASDNDELVLSDEDS